MVGEFEGYFQIDIDELCTNWVKGQLEILPSGYVIIKDMESNYESMYGPNDYKRIIQTSERRYDGMKTI